MKIGKFPPIALLLVAFVVTAAAQPPRYVERHSTDPGRDLDRVSVIGKIEKIDGQRALLRTSDGEEITVHLGPQHYWHQKGYQLRTGVIATVDGWGELYTEDGGYIFAGSIYGDGFHFDLSDSRGYPRWADRDDWSDDWCPRIDYYEVHYHAPPPWQFRPYWGWGPPPPHGRWQHHPRWHHRHDRPGPPPPPPRPHHPPRHRY